MKFPFVKREFDENTFFGLIRSLEMMFNSITLDENFSSTIKTVDIPANTEIALYHGLKEAPKYRIILRQKGAVLITDDTPWTDKVIYLKNNDAAIDTTITVMIVRS